MPLLATQLWVLNKLQAVGGGGGGGGAVDSVNGYTGVVTLTKSDIGLGNVNNTSDLNKPISTATQTALDAKQNLIQTGTTTLDFGPFPGTNEASATITGQTAITSANIPDAMYRQEATSDHTVNDHTYAALLSSLTCTVPTAGTGFTITARSAEKLQGTFNINWRWI